MTSNIFIKKFKVSENHALFLCTCILVHELNAVVSDIYKDEYDTGAESVICMLVGDDSVSLTLHDNGWIEVSSGNQDLCIDAYQYIKPELAHLEIPSPETTEVIGMGDVAIEPAKTPYVTTEEVKRGNIVWSVIRKIETLVKSKSS